MSRHGTTRHHRRPRSRGGNSKPSNISYVCAEQHKAYHRIFSNMTPYEIADVLNQVWIDPAYTFVVVQGEGT
jgi:hypothetical protein